MKSNWPIIRVITLAALGSACCHCGNVQAQSGTPWLLVDDFQYYSSAFAYGVASDPAGNIYAVGNGVSNSLQHALTRKSSDGGASWVVVDDFVYPGGGGNMFSKASADSSGNVFVVGHCGGHWVVRRSQDKGSTWTTLDDYVGPSAGVSGASATPMGLFVGSSGVVYVVGSANKELSGGKNPTWANDWIVRRSLDYGATWTTVDDYECEPGVSGGLSIAYGATVSSAGIFVAGTAHSGGWIVRQSLTGDPGTWTNVDAYNPSVGAGATAISVDANGRLYAVGDVLSGSKGCSYYNWVVRRSSDGGKTWATVDNLGPDAGSPCGDGVLPFDFTFDASNDIVVVGNDANGSGSFWLTRSSYATATSSSGDPGTWVTTDSYQYPGITSASGRNVIRDPLGNLFAVGGSGRHWLVRKKSP